MLDYNKPWYKFNALQTNNISVTAKNFNWATFLKQSKFADQPVGIWDFQGRDMLQVLNKDWLDYIADTVMPVASFVMFYRRPYFVHPTAHVDLSISTKEPHIFAINTVISSDDDGYMTWYDVPNNSGKIAKTAVDTDYLYWPMEEVKDREFSRVIIGDELTLVRTDIPHNIIVNKNPRVVVSLRFKYISDIHNWESCVDYFSKYF